MGKQKIVIGISMKDQKARTKAFKIAVSLSGVDSASIQAEKGQLEVVGDVDAVALASQLRKRLGQAELLSVASAEKKEDKKEVKKDETPKPQTVTITYDPSASYHYAAPYQYHAYPVQDQQPECSIM
ncbi:PREDICTED: heavy metal-associated isoprenylated plant protein 39-like [Ipomoea nil]|uniref:heavy metal-associated isoprenylated plant protein 39-like n=1 Tax=Ipomoea nil TaxID=35883 RepID=UPI000900ED1E|nr:PREDICTED: heavy metal-associated isoprenylated plant protein 39-like [Ipomoea nil]XP_019153953.1 PREDICTED: heavy metal-associated isoprenylated plant protein 39-like [Ipomoea nil]XP_019153954.1 PREDICTED: heavy metal-associated isoprenylated plant protein 39-like [Ipomoea nil]XP_019153955.1 PREDICTED: heavy metal-associated isoprenylated plant protein 39-like [Ipomoea nil]